MGWLPELEVSMNPVCPLPAGIVQVIGLAHQRMLPRALRAACLALHLVSDLIHCHKSGALALFPWHQDLNPFVLDLLQAYVVLPLHLSQALLIDLLTYW